MTSDRASQMCGGTGAGDDNADSTICRISRKLCGSFGRTMGGENLRFVWHGELIERLNCMTHRFPIRFAAHYYGDQSV